MDDKYLLPDAPLPELPPVPPASPAGPHREAAEAWTAAAAAAWIASPRLAGWARDWLRALARRHGEPWPGLLAAGLGPARGVPRWLAGDAPEATWLRQYLERSDLAHAWFRQGFLADDPEWLVRLLRTEEARVARSFLLSGNINDYAFDPVHGYRQAVRLLVDALMRAKDCVLTYRLSQGLVCHSHDAGARDRLPQPIRMLLEAPGFDSQVPLLTQVCHLFDELRRWLAGAATGGPDSSEFPRGVAIVFENVHLLIPPNRADVERNFLVDNLLHWSVSPELFRSSHCLILLAESLEDVGSELRARGGKIEQIAVPRPEAAGTRLKFLLPLLDPGSRMAETRVSQLPQGQAWLAGYGGGTYLERLDRLSHDTAGLSLLGIEDLLQQASTAPERGLRREEVMLLKRERLRQESEGLLEVLDPHRRLDSVGGYAALKARLREVVVSLQGAQDELVRASVPMGILFFGPPGTGKSIVAEALAGESGISMAKLGDFRGMYVGESERNLSRILSLIEALHPVIVFVDEIDQAFGNRQQSATDGGVDKRVFGRLLEFMSDTRHRGRILWIGASNFPNDLDPAMKRAGRFDLVLPFLLPDEESRREILRVILEGALSGVPGVAHRLRGEDFADLATRTAGYSGAELGAVVGEVLRRLATRRAAGDAAEVTADLFRSVLAVYRPPPGVRERYREMEELAIREVSFIDLLPEPYRSQRAAPAGAPGA
jgi:transitional endoplasmic reticulum ATPase